MSNGIPTFRGGGAAGTALFNQLLRGSIPAGARPSASITGGLPTARRGTPIVRKRPPMPEIGLRGIRDISALPAGGGMTSLQRDLAAKMGLGAQKPEAPKAPPSLMDRLTPAVGTPAFAGLSEAAATGLQLSGYQDKPITTGQGLGAMFSAGMKAYQEQKRADLADRIAMAKLSQKSDFEKKLALAGIDPTTPEGKKKVQEMLMKPSTVFMGGDEQKKEAYKAALATRKDMMKQVNTDRELGVRLQQAIDLLASGTETGRLQSAMLPLKQLAREANILGDEELQNLSNLEVINSIASFLTPRMRVVGAGASSDRDMDFFASATVKMSNSPEANLVIATMQKQVMDYNRERLDLFDDYVKERGDDFGFGKFADEKLGQVYKRATTDDELTELVDSGAIKEGDVFYNGITGEFDILTKEMM
jgi:hypothetical protein